MSVQQKILKALASLQLTVVLFALSMVLVFWGTVAQSDLPNWAVVEKYFRSPVVMLDMKYLSFFMQKFFELPKDVEFNFKLPYPGGWLLGTAMLLNLIAAHLMRFRLTWKRAGVLITHTGLVLLMLGELFTGVFAIESRMTMKVGEKCNFLDVHYEPWRTPVELAFIDSSGEKEDEVVVLPSDHLKKVGEKISHELLPVDVEILTYSKNSELSPETTPNADTIYRLDGRAYKSVPSEEFSDLAEEHAAAPMIKVRFTDKTSGNDLGTHLFSLWQYSNAFNRIYAGQPRTIDANNKTYRVEFRGKRIVEPFTLELLKFDHDRYEGTNKPRNYASTVRLIDPENGVDRVEKIAMNEPLRYRGLSFFQSGVLPGDAGTVLQVVRNPSWLIPYIACSVISVGLLIHFVIGLNAFLARRGAARPASFGVYGTLFDRLAPWITVALAATYLGVKSLPHGVDEESIDYRAIGDLPILDGGRVKPLDSLARSSMLAITSKQEWRDENENWHPAIEWLVTVLDSADPRFGPAAEAKIFRIEHDDLLKIFELPKRPGFYRYSLNELLPRYERFERELEQASNRAGLSKRNLLKQSHEDDLRDGKIIELSEKISIYLRLVRGKPSPNKEQNAMRPRLVPPTESGGDGWRSLIQIDQEIKFTPEQREAQKQETTKRILREIEADGGDPKAVPQDKLQLFVEREAEQDLLRNPSPEARAVVSEAAGLLTTIFRAASRHAQEKTREGRVEQARICNEALEKVQKFYDTLPAKKRFSAELESYLSHSTIFFYTCMLYIFVMLLGCSSWLVWGTPLRRSAFWLAVFASTVHGLALVARMVISERPPVTNLYGSAIFIGWGCMGICLILEAIFKNGIGTVGGGILGAMATFIAHNNLAETGDTLDVLQAVLDTNFWLSVHVLTVTLGYVATLVMGVIGLVYLIAGIFLPVMDKAMSKTLGMMMYGTCCFAMLLSFFGTTSGGIWGDQSWGRFWGWDPKENGAVLVVIWNALILHARWCGLIKERGMAVLALVGNMVTFWSWFGTNQLGIGLHAYGFNEKLAAMCRWVWLGHLFMIILAAMPLSWWSSYSTLTATPARPAEEGTTASAVAPVDAPSIEAVETVEVAGTAPKSEAPRQNGHTGGKKKGKNRR